MNILVLSWRDPKHPLAGGAEQVMHEHMKGWVRAGHKVTLFSSLFKGVKRKENLNGVEIIREGFMIFGVHILAYKFYLKNKQKFDLVIDQFHGIPFFTPLYVKKPILAVLQEVAREVWFMNDFPFPINYIIGILGFVAEPIIFRFYRKICFMVGSQSAKEDLIDMKIPFKNITIVSHGVKIKKPKPFPKKEIVKTIIYLGALAKDKGVKDAIKTFSILNKKGKYQFWIVGKGGDEYKNKLLAVCEGLGLINKVKFWGFVSEDTKFELLARAHVLINPSIREGWGLVNIEANSMGTPVVAYKSPGLIDSVKDGESGILCSNNIPEVMAKEVFSLLTDKTEYERLQRGAIFWSNKFSWKKSRRQSLQLIEDIV